MWLSGHDGWPRTKSALCRALVRQALLIGHRGLAIVAELFRTSSC